MSKGGLVFDGVKLRVVIHLLMLPLGVFCVCSCIFHVITTHGLGLVRRILFYPCLGQSGIDSSLGGTLRGGSIE